MPADLLKTIASMRKERIAAQKAAQPLEVESLIAQGLPSHPSFYEALKKPGLSYICEIKRASPSKGIIADTIDPAGLAAQYEQAGARAISCLSEPDFFLGSDDHVQQAIVNCTLPVLRKDFVVDPYMILQAAKMGAAAVLLIVSLLNDQQLRENLDLCKRLDLDALVECRTLQEIERACQAGARILGVNNRNLHDFSVDPTHAARLLSCLKGSDLVLVCESGMRTPQDIAAQKAAGMDAVLIGEAMMKADDKTAMLHWLDQGQPDSNESKQEDQKHHKSEDPEDPNNKNPEDQDNKNLEDQDNKNPEDQKNKYRKESSA